jgi:hypothetical protein
LDKVWQRIYRELTAELSVWLPLWRMESIARSSP